MIRTRAITDHLDYDNLVARGIIPDIVPSIQPTALTVKRYPPFVYSCQDDDKFSFFGMFMDYIIRAGLRVNLTQSVELGIDTNAEAIQTLPDTKMLEIMDHLNKYETSRNMNDIAQAALVLTSMMYGKSLFNREQIQGYVPTLVNIVKEIINHWNILGTYLTGTVKFNAEYTHGSFSSHPDIVTDNCVLDIKNTASFTKMSKSSCLQVLAYYAVIKLTNPGMQYIGFVLPMQRDIAIFSLGNWNPAAYLELLAQEANTIETKEVQVTVDENTDMELLMVQLAEMGITREQLMQMLEPEPQGFQQRIMIGGHIAKGKNIATTLQDFINRAPGRPCQMFLGNPRTGGQDAKTPGQITAAAQVIRNSGLIYFTHAPYVINLCANAFDEKEYWQQRILNDDLRLTAAMGGRGVVVHTGARKHLSEEEALVIMEYMVRTALPHATEQCPLLLETPCGEGTEVVTKIEELGQFFYRFNEDECKKLGLCVDTCHIFAAAYDPLTYMQHWEKHCPVPIKLVHFNDSKGEFGSRVDRHAAPGQGHIGMKKMEEIAIWCHERSIPMVRE